MSPNYNRFLQLSPKLADLYLKTFYNDYLDQKIIALHPYIKKSNLFLLLSLVANSIDQNLSANALSIKAHLNPKTVRKYLDLLISSQILFELKYFDTKQNTSHPQKSRLFFLDQHLLDLLLRKTTVSPPTHPSPTNRDRNKNMNSSPTHPAKQDIEKIMSKNNLFLSILASISTDSTLFYTTFHSHFSFLIQTPTSKTLITALTPKSSPST